MLKKNKSYCCSSMSYLSPNKFPTMSWIHFSKSWFCLQNKPMGTSGTVLIAGAIYNTPMLQWLSAFSE